MTQTKTRSQNISAVKISEKCDIPEENYESDDTSSVSSETGDKRYLPPTEKKVSRKNSLDKQICNALDRANILNSAALLVLSTVSNSLGVNVENVS